MQICKKCCNEKIKISGTGYCKICVEKFKSNWIAIIYIVVNQINGHYYVGRHICKNVDIFNKYCGSGKLLNEAYIKYGKENFKKYIIQVISLLEYNKEESYWIKEFKAQTKYNEGGYNISPGDDGGNNYDPLKNIDIEKRRREKISQTKTGNSNRTEESKKKQKETVKLHQKNGTYINGMQGKHQREETKEKQRKKIKERQKNGTYINSFAGKSHTFKTIIKLKTKLKFVMNSFEVNQKLRVSSNKRWDNYAKIILYNYKHKNSEFTCINLLLDNINIKVGKRELHLSNSLSII